MSSSASLLAEISDKTFDFPVHENNCFILGNSCNFGYNVGLICDRDRRSLEPGLEGSRGSHFYPHCFRFGIISDFSHSTLNFHYWFYSTQIALHDIVDILSKLTFCKL